MSRNTLAVVVVVMVVTSAFVFGSSAYTTATVERTGDMNVVSDTSGLIGLDPGVSGLVVSNSSGELKIDFTQNSATGVNTNANYTLGDPASPTTKPAFNVTNNGGDSKTFNISYDGFDTSDAEDNLQFRVYDDTGAFVTELNQSSQSGSATIPSGTTYYVVMIVNTGDGVADLETSADLSGTLKITV